MCATAPWGRFVAAAPPMTLRGVESFRTAVRLYVTRRLRSRPMGAGRTCAAHRQRGPPPRCRSLGGSPAPSRSAPLPTVGPRHGGRGYGRAVSRPTGAAFLSAPPANPRCSPPNGSVRRGFSGSRVDLRISKYSKEMVILPTSLGYPSPFLNNILKSDRQLYYKVFRYNLDSGGRAPRTPLGV